METSLNVLLTSAVGIGFIHTLIGVDHTLPFIVMGRARSWSLRRVLGLTCLCGLGHVLSSVILGGLGIGLGVALSRLEWVESTRGELASWALIVFGLGYAGWSVARLRRRQRHIHEHSDGTIHAHDHDGSHIHGPMRPATMTAWSLFIIFVLGPCEPLIPMLMAPAATLGLGPAALVAVAFGSTTIATMAVIVTIGYFGLRLPTFHKLTPHIGTLAGLAVAASGVAIKLFGI